MENILQIADLTKRYPDFYLDHLTLNVPSGSIVGLIGENGAGKTTTMNLILNVIFPLCSLPQTLKPSCVKSMPNGTPTATGSY